MRLPIRVWAGLYGVAFHAVAIGLAVWTARRNQAEIPATFWWQIVPPLLVAAFVVYALVAGSYVPKRPDRKGLVFFDSVMGMVAELGIAALTSILYAFVTATGALAQGFGAYLAAAGSTTLFAFLWLLAGRNSFITLLVVGNAAGLVGWWVLKKVGAPRAAPPA